MGICYSQPLPITQEKGDEMTGAEAEKYSMPLVIPAEKRKMAPPPLRVVPMSYSLNPGKQYHKTLTKSSGNTDVDR